MRRQAKAPRDGLSWLKQYRWELTVLMAMVLVGMTIGWATRSTPPNAGDVMLALQEYAAFAADDEAANLPDSPREMTLGEVAARTRHVKLLKTKESDDDDYWLADTDVSIAWTGSQATHIKLQFRMRQKGTAWIITDARHL